MSNVFILGSGFTKDISNGKSPTLSELGKEIKKIIPEETIKQYQYDGFEEMGRRK